MSQFLGTVLWLTAYNSNNNSNIHYLYWAIPITGSVFSFYVCFCTSSLQQLHKVGIIISRLEKWKLRLRLNDFIECVCTQLEPESSSLIVKLIGIAVSDHLDKAWRNPFLFCGSVSSIHWEYRLPYVGNNRLSVMLSTGRLLQHMYIQRCHF